MSKNRECISVFDMLKIGVGPSSSHTLGPWRAARRFIKKLKDNELFDSIEAIQIDLYGSLSLTGKGHATDISVIMGLTGADPQTFPIENITQTVEDISAYKRISINGEHSILFDPKEAIIFHKNFLPFHPNGITFIATLPKEHVFECFPRPVEKATDLLVFCKNEQKSISEIVLENECYLLSEAEVNSRFKQIWDVMLDSMYVGCHTEGTLPGGLNVRRRAFDTHKKLIKDGVNASLGRVVTAPTNGSAGVIPAVMMYYMVIENHDANFDDIRKFLLVAGEIGSLFKKGATISAAMGGCQAEIGDL